jgi:hypothetical protein
MTSSSSHLTKAWDDRKIDDWPHCIIVACVRVGGKAKKKKLAGRRMHLSKQCNNTLTCSYIYVIKIGTKQRTRLELVQEQVIIVILILLLGYYYLFLRRYAYPAGCCTKQ